MGEKPTRPTEINAELVYYMFDQIQLELREIKKEYVTKTESLALKQEIHNLRTDFAEYKENNSKELSSLRERKQARDTVLWVGLVASAIINIVALYNLFTK